MQPSLMLQTYTKSYFDLEPIELNNVTQFSDLVFSILELFVSRQLDLSLEPLRELLHVRSGR